MKKIPLVLSAFTLAATSTGVFATSLSGQGTLEPANMMPTGLAITGLQAENVTTDANLTLTNQFDMRAKLETIELDRNRVNWASSMLGTGNYTRKIIMVYRNYEEGVTEEMADERMLHLGEDDSSDWAVKLLDYDAGNTVPATVKSLSILKDHNLLENKSDMLYYAILVAPMTRQNGQNEWGEGYWVRGKIDYRSCIHSAAYREGEMFCSQKTAVGDDGIRRVYYVLRNREGMSEVAMPENETVITWADEWRQLQIEHYNELNTQLGELDYNVRNATGLLDSIGQGLSRLERTLAQTEGVDDQVAGVARAQTTLKALRDYYEQLLRDGSKDELANLQAEIARLHSEAQTAAAENATLRDENSALITEKDNIVKERDGLVTEKMALTAEKDNIMKERDGLADEKAALEAENAELRLEVERLRAEATEDKEESGCPKPIESDVTDSDVTDLGKTEQPEVNMSQTTTVKGQGTTSEASVTPRLIQQPAVDQEQTVANDVPATTDNQKPAETEEVSEVGKVPNLGEVKEHKPNLYWLLLLLVVTVGCCGLWLKKVVGRRNG